MNESSKPLLSVIVPVYNKEKYVTKCIESILNQSYVNLEIVLVDDGSTDSSGRICDHFARIDSRIKCIHKENEGHYKAMRDGVAMATGSYITQVDADDWIEKEMYSCLMNLAIKEKADIVTSGVFFDSYDKNGILSEVRCTDRAEEGIYMGERYRHLCESLVYDDGLHEGRLLVTANSKIFREKTFSSIILANNFELSRFVDLSYTFPTILCSERVVVSHDVFYHYVQNTSLQGKNDPLEKALNCVSSLSSIETVYSRYGSVVLQSFYKRACRNIGELMADACENTSICFQTLSGCIDYCKQLSKNAELRSFYDGRGVYTHMDSVDRFFVRVMRGYILRAIMSEKMYAAWKNTEKNVKTILFRSHIGRTVLRIYKGNYENKDRVL